jgi:tetratricopeptide (TPR) repeat protein
VNGRRWRLLGLIAVELLVVVGGFVVNLFSGLFESGWAKNPYILLAALLVIVAVTVGLKARLDRGNPEHRQVTSSGTGSGSGPTFAVSGGSITGSTFAETINNHYHNIAAESVPVVASVGQVVVGEIPREPPAFQPRADLIADVESALSNGGRAVVCALAGGRGVGKSQLAGAYARRQIAAGCPLVGWVTAETAEQTLAGLASIAERLGVADPDGDSGRSALRLRDHLSTRDAEGLLVFDNATDAAHLAAHAPTGSRVQVVVTTTDRGFTGLGRVVDVEEYTRRESVAYLSERTGLNDPDGADAVAGELGDSPLGLGQAAAVILARRLSYQQYSALLAEQTVGGLLTARKADPYPRGLAEAVELSLATVGYADPESLAGHVLRVLAVLSPDGVPRTLLLPLDDSSQRDGDRAAKHPGPPRKLDAALERITGASLASWTGSGETASIVMHRLVARIIRERVHAEGALAATVDAAAPLVVAAIPLGRGAWAARGQAQHLPDQANALWAAAKPLSTIPDAHSTLAAVLDARQRIVRYLHDNADLTRALAAATTVATDCQQVLGADHPDTLTSRNNLAYAYRSAGDLDRAIPLHEQTLADRERVLGADHPDTLTSRNNLAYAYRSAGDLDRAIPLYEQTLTDSERVLGADHPNTLTSRNNLAYAYESAGDLDRAIPLYEQTLTDSERVLTGHPMTAAIRANLERALAAQKASQTVRGPTN